MAFEFFAAVRSIAETNDVRRRDLQEAVSELMQVAPCASAGRSRARIAEMPTTWSVELRHEGLNAYRVIRGRDRNEVQQRAAMQQRAWDLRWAALRERQVLRDERARRIYGRQSQREHAAALTAEAESAILALRSTLARGLNRTTAIDFVVLEDHDAFPTPQPSQPKLYTVAPRPERDNYGITLSFLGYLIPQLRRHREAEADAAFAAALEQWTKHHDGVHAANAALEREYGNGMNAWKGALDTFLRDQAAHNAGVRQLARVWD